MAELPLLILDFDGTLIWSEEVKSPCDFTIMAHGQTIYVRKRPGLDAFLEFCRQNFRLAIWTAGKRAYADALVEVLFPDDALEFVFTREHTTIQRVSPQEDPVYRKPLTRAWNWTLWKYNRGNTRILDDTPETYAYNLDSAVAISTWTDELDDTELSRVTVLLRFWKAELMLPVMYSEG